jgi:FkbM family methyltransferase
MLRAGRRWAADLIARWVAKSPRREPSFIRAGRWADHHSYILATLYTHTLQQLIRRLREQGNVYRRVSIGGLQLDVDVTDQTFVHEYFYGVAHRYEPGLVEYLAAHLHHGDVFVDVGANIGFFSLMAATLVGQDGHVAAFEPHPVARAAMVKLLQTNGVSERVDVVGAALDECAGTGRLHLSIDSVLSTLDPAKSPARQDFAFDTAIEVPLTTLDVWLADRQELLRRLAVIKIDVEGGEDRVLGGMLDALRKLPAPRVVCETVLGSDADRRLRQLGFVPRGLDGATGGFGNYAYEPEQRS